MKKIIFIIFIFVFYLSFTTPVFASTRHHTTTNHHVGKKHYTHHTILNYKYSTKSNIIDAITIYNSDLQGLYLIGKDIIIENIDTQSIWNMLIDEPKGVKVLNWKVDNGIGYLDLSKEFVESYNGGSTQASVYIYSAVNTFCFIKGVSGIQFLIEGEKIPILFEMDNGVFAPRIDI